MEASFQEGSWACLPEPHSDAVPSQLGSADLGKERNITAAWLPKGRVLISCSANSWVNLYIHSSNPVEKTVANSHVSEPPWLWDC